MYNRGGDSYVKVGGPTVGVTPAAQCVSDYAVWCPLGYMNSMSGKVRGLSPPTLKFRGA